MSAEPERETLAEVVARDGALPMPVGPGPLPLTADERARLADLIGGVKPADAKLLNAFGESVRDCREHEHPKSEDFHCLNLTAWMGERAGLVLRRLLGVEAENALLRSAAAELGVLREVNRKQATDLAGAELAVAAMRPGYEAASGLRSRVVELEGLLRDASSYAARLEGRLREIEQAPFSLGEDADTLPAWLYQRFMPDGEGWDALAEDDRSYWEHQARAVRRAVQRGGFKSEPGGA